MANVIREYDLDADSKHRITLRSPEYTSWHAVEFDDGRIMLEPRPLRNPEMISALTVAHMDEAIRQMVQGYVGEEFDLGEVEALIHED